MSDASVSHLLEQAADRPKGRLYAAPDGRTARIIRSGDGYRVLLDDGQGLPGRYVTLLEAQMAALKAMAGPPAGRSFRRKRPLLSRASLLKLQGKGSADLSHLGAWTMPD